MLNARQVERAQTDRLDHIQYLSEPVGSGKTQAVINEIRDNQEQSYIFVSPTIKLATEIKGRLDGALANDGQGENVLLTVTAPGEGVTRRIMRLIEQRPAQDHHTLVITTKAFKTVLRGERREHSRKPAEFYDLLLRVSPEPRLDIFSRENHDGFDAWGNETGKVGADAAPEAAA